MKYLKFFRTGLICGLLFVPLVVISSFAAEPVLTEKNFRQDIAYYQRTAKLKNLNANDRLYILDRLRKKYSQSDFDLTDLYAEIDRWTTAKQKESKNKPAKVPEEKPAENVQAPPVPPVPPTPVETTAPPAPPKKTQSLLSKVLVTEGKEVSKVLLDVDESTEYKEILKKDEKGRQPPVIILYLYNTQEKLSALARNFRVKSGVIGQVQSRQVTSKPLTVRVSISLKKDRPHEITREGNQLVVTVQKNEAAPVKAAEEASQESTAAIQSVAPTVLPPAEQTMESSPLTPLAESPVESNQPIEKGDILDIQVSPAEEFSQQTVVQVDNTIDMPVLGRVKAAGITAKQLETALIRRLSEIVPKPEVKVSVQKAAGTQVFLAGQVKTPGVYEYGPELKCFEFISKTGGFLDDADKKNVTVYRGTQEKRTSIVFNVEEFLNTADPSRDIPLLAGDLIEVPRKTNFIYLVGAVKTQGRQEFKDGMKVMGAIYQAGGLDEKAQSAHVRIVRNEEGKKLVRELNANELLKDPEKDVALKAGDMIFVPSTSNMKKNLGLRKAAPWLAFFGSLALVLGLLL